MHVIQLEFSCFVSCSTESHYVLLLCLDSSLIDLDIITYVHFAAGYYKFLRPYIVMSIMK